MAQYIKITVLLFQLLALGACVMTSQSIEDDKYPDWTWGI